MKRFDCCGNQLIIMIKSAYLSLPQPTSAYLYIIIKLDKTFSNEWPLSSGDIANLRLSDNLILFRPKYAIAMGELKRIVKVKL